MHPAIWAAGVLPDRKAIAWQSLVAHVAACECGRARKCQLILRQPFQWPWLRFNVRMRHPQGLRRDRLVREVLRQRRTSVSGAQPSGSSAASRCECQPAIGHPCFSICWRGRLAFGHHRLPATVAPSRSRCVFASVRTSRNSPHRSGRLGMLVDARCACRQGASPVLRRRPAPITQR